MCFSFLLFGCTNKNANKQETAEITLEDQDKNRPDIPFDWNAANVYFLLTDRFEEGKSSVKAEEKINRPDSTAVLRGFEGGNIAGIREKIESGYFNDLGINAIWFTPIVEQIHGSTDEGTGNTYGYHGYWTKDWTAIDPQFGNPEELRKLVESAHKRGIRILMDVVLNHTGPVTDNLDPVWPKEWVRTEPACDFQNYDGTTACTLVKNLPDILTESDAAVELPDALLAKWKKEGRLSKELDELQVFFNRTGYPRAPRFYIIKWLTDYIHEYGIDGYRVDTVKHVNENAWAELRKEADYAFETWKKKNPSRVLDNTPFYMVGEVYNYGASGGRDFDFGDRQVDYYDHGFNSLINFELKYDAAKDYETVFAKYSKLLNTKLKGLSVMNYLSSHDDGAPFDPDRKQGMKSANMLLLSPGVSQVYYGDETLRPLRVEGAEGDAHLRSSMNWEALQTDSTVQKVHSHYQKLGQFRRNHPAVGAGKHKMLSEAPYVFSRTYRTEAVRDKIVVGLDLPAGPKTLSVKGFFGDGTALFDVYSETEVMVENGQVQLDSPYDTVLLELVQPQLEEE